MNVFDGNISKYSTKAKHSHADNRENYDYDFIEIPELFKIFTLVFLYLTNFVKYEVDNRNDKNHLKNYDNYAKATQIAVKTKNRDRVVSDC